MTLHGRRAPGPDDRTRPQAAEFASTERGPSVQPHPSNCAIDGDEPGSLLEKSNAGADGFARPSIALQGGWQALRAQARGPKAPQDRCTDLSIHDHGRILLESRQIHECSAEDREDGLTEILSDLIKSTNLDITSKHATNIVNHLASHIQDYFSIVEQLPLPDRLSNLVARFEAQLRAANERVEQTFRDDLIRALPALRTFAMSISANSARADDLVQETMLRAWTNREKFQRSTNFKAWLFTILRNQFYSECRKARREIEDADGTHAATQVAAAVQEHAVVLGSIMNLIGTLPLPQRQALLLVGAEGFTYEEAAAHLGCQIGTVKSRVSRARSVLVEALESSIHAPDAVNFHDLQR